MKGVFAVAVCAVVLFCVLPAFAGLFDDDFDWGIWQEREKEYRYSVWGDDYSWGRITIRGNRYSIFDINKGFDYGRFRRFGHFYTRYSIGDGFDSGFIWQIGPFVTIESDRYGEKEYFISGLDRLDEEDDDWLWILLLDE